MIQVNLIHNSLNVKSRDDNNFFQVLVENFIKNATTITANVLFLFDSVEQLSAD